MFEICDTSLFEYISKMLKQDHCAPCLTPSTMVPMVLLVLLDPPWSAISGVWLHEVDQAESRWTRSGPGTRAGPWCCVVDQGCSEPVLSTKKHFPDVFVTGITILEKGVVISIPHNLHSSVRP